MCAQTATGNNSTTRYRYKFRKYYRKKWYRRKFWKKYNYKSLTDYHKVSFRKLYLVAYGGQSATTKADIFFYPQPYQAQNGNGLQVINMNDIMSWAPQYDTTLPLYTQYKVTGLSIMAIPNMGNFGTSTTSWQGSQESACIGILIPNSTNIGTPQFSTAVNDKDSILLNPFQTVKKFVKISADWLNYENTPKLQIYVVSSASMAPNNAASWKVLFTVYVTLRGGLFEKNIKINQLGKMYGDKDAPQ